MSDTVILSRKDVAQLLTIGECMDAVETAFRSFAEGKTEPPKVLGLHAKGGGLHIKAGIMNLNKNYTVAKLNSNFPGNTKQYKLPTIQGAVAVFDADNGALIIFDSTGTALQDVASAAIVYERAVAKGLGQIFNFQD